MPVRTIRTQRLYEQIAAQIEDLVRQGELKPGDRLPSEAELARTLGVSRPSVREAMIALETVGLVEVLTGSGTFVREVAPAHLNLPWASGREPGPGLLEQFQTRQVIEPELAALAAKVANPQEIAALGAIVDRMEQKLGSQASLHPDHLAFHVKLAQASGNLILANLMRTLFVAYDDPMWSTLRTKAYAIANLRKGIIFRRQLVAALTRRNAVEARAIVRRHLNRLYDLYFGSVTEELTSEDKKATGGELHEAVSTGQ
ncbi:FadR/GntR family transcriptional regulator [Acidisphaera sp. S103]|uniref:FadR/GntR family transcriptional regulator n=1 Tax=Acidisphaera sp. S103 TaxID=1747223 RepID=UPI00131A6DB3|nr:FadR/GntR family transcriptional regulator [Acidisphaera sp. S103]